MLPVQKARSPGGVSTVPRLEQDHVEALSVDMMEQMREDLDSEAGIKSTPPHQRHHRAQHGDNPWDVGH